MVATRQTLRRLFVQSQNSLYVCRSCRTQLSRSSPSIQQQRFVSSDGISTSDPVRRTTTKSINFSRPKSTLADSKFSGTRQPNGLPEMEVSERGMQTDLGEPQTITRNTAAAKEDEYVPAETWEGLEFVGSRGNWHDMPAQPGDEFSSWLSSTSYTAGNRTELVSCLHQAFVECLMCDHLGYDLEVTSKLHASQFDADISDAFSSAKISLGDSDHTPSVQIATDLQEKVTKLLSNVYDSLHAAEWSEPATEPETKLGEEETITEVETFDELDNQIPAQPVQTRALHYTVQDEYFLTYVLDMDRPLTFALLKRFSQLSGHHIPDSILNQSFSGNKPLSYLIERLDQMVVRPKPKKVADLLLNKPGLENYPNLLVFPRRETSVDKEKEVGRWKIIERELRERGLPVLGRLKPQQH